MNLGDLHSGHMDPVEVGGTGVTMIDASTRLALITVMPHDFGSGPVMAAKVALAESTGESTGWVGVGSAVRAAGRVWTVTHVTPPAEGGPHLRMEPASPN